MIEEMQVYYDRRAEIYDASMGYDNTDTVARLQPVIDHICGAISKRQVLELACGPCFWTQFTSQMADSVVACDFNESTLAQARLKDLPWDKVSLRQADAYDLKEVGGPFSAAMAVDWLAHVPYSRIPSFLEGVHSVLSSDAQVVFCDQLPRSRAVTGEYDSDGNLVVMRQLPDGSNYRVIKHYMSDEKIRQIFNPYDDCIEIKRFPDCRRIVLSYTVKNR